MLAGWVFNEGESGATKTTKVDVSVDRRRAQVVYRDSSLIVGCLWLIVDILGIFIAESIIYSVLIELRSISLFALVIVFAFDIQRQLEKDRLIEWLLDAGFGEEQIKTIFEKKYCRGDLRDAK